MIRKAKIEDSERIAAIYNHFVVNTKYTFDEFPQPITKFSSSIEKGNPFLVYEENGKVMGFAYAVQWKVKNAYRFIYESTIYLDLECTAKGIGSRLYQALIEESRKRGLHSLIACISLPHDISVSFHEKHGFKKVGHVSEAGYKFDKWIDVGYWQLLL